MAYPPPVPSIADADRSVVYTGDGASQAFDVPFPIFGDGEDITVYVNGVWQGGWTSGAWTLESRSGVALPNIALPITDGFVQLKSVPANGAIVEIYGFWHARQGILETSPGITRREYQQNLGQVVAAIREQESILWGALLSRVARAKCFLAFDANGNPYPFAGMIPATSVAVSAPMVPVVGAASYPSALSILGFATWFQTLIGATSSADFYTRIGGTSFGGSLAGAANAAAALTLLGVSPYMQSLLPAANAATALAGLGLSSFGQSLVDDANAGAALTTLGLSSLAQSVVAQTTAGQIHNLLGGGSFRRQTALGGPISPADGLPFFLPTTATTLSITSQNLSSTAPLVVTSSNGAASGGANDLIGIAVANITWPSLTANATNYLYLTVGADGSLTPSSGILAPLYQGYATPSTANKQVTFNAREMKAYIGNGSSAAQANIVVVGEAVCGTSTVTSAIPYAYNGAYVSPPVAIPAVSSQATFTHNLGVPPVGYTPGLRLVCVTSNLSYPVGAEIGFGAAAANGGTLAAVDGHTAALSTDNAVTINAAPYGGGNMVAITNASWNLRFYAARNF